MSSDNGIKVQKSEAVAPAEGKAKPKPTAHKRDRFDPLIGETIANRYTVTTRIGAGGMGVVYLAEQSAMDRKVALKVIPRDLDDETLIERFHREARAASQLSHPNTITLYDFGEHKEILYIAMEFLDGVPLNKAIKAGVMEPGRVINILSQSLRSLAEAHKKGIVHRDIKPDNLFLIGLDGMNDFVKVLDFGVAKFSTSNDKTLTQAGMIFGTPKYMSPEQARSKDLDARSDIYAIGVMGYEMLCNSIPFDADDHVSILLKHCTEPIPDFKTINPDVDIPDDVAQVIFKAMAKRPDDRYQSAEDMVMALDALASKYPYHSSSGALPTYSSSGMRAANSTPVPVMGTGEHAYSTGDQSLPPMGRHSPSEMNLTPSGSVNWTSNLELDLGVTSIGEALPEPAGEDQSKMLILVGGGIAALLVIVVGLLVAFGGDDNTVEEKNGNTTATTNTAGKALTEKATTPKKVETPPPETTATADTTNATTSVAATGAGSETTGGKTTEVAPEAPKMVKLEITSVPEGAAIHSAAGKLLGKTPKTLERELGEGKLELIVKKAGFFPSKTSVELAKDATVKVELKRKPKTNGGKGTGGLRDPYGGGR